MRVLFFFLSSRMQADLFQQWLFGVAVAVNLVMGDLAECELTRQQYAQSPACSGEGRQFWERVRSRRGIVCSFDASAFKMNCTLPGGCVDAPVASFDEPVQQVEYDCGTCGSGAQALLDSLRVVVEMTAERVRASRRSREMAVAGISGHPLVCACS